MAERGTKTTFLLSDSRRAKLKKLAAERDTTVTELLAEGADLVLEKYRRVEDWETLQRRAEEVPVAEYVRLAQTIQRAGAR